MLAGISADYYLRLERGRDRNPSVQVLASIARVLRLDEEHVAHLFSLACEAPRPPRRRSPGEIVPTGALKLLDALVQPAFIEGRYLDVLASNRLARALSPGLAVGRNQLRDLFLDPTEQAHYPSWEEMAECYVASFRQSVGNDIDDPRFIELTGELALAGEHFRQLWARHEVRAPRETRLRIEHPQVGPLMLHREQLRVSGAEGLMLIVYHPEAGSADADKLALLASADLPTMDAEPGLRRSGA